MGYYLKITKFSICIEYMIYTPLISKRIESSDTEFNVCMTMKYNYILIFCISECKFRPIF